MEDRVDNLIVAVANYPELWKVWIPEYSNRLKKELAWKSIADQLNLPVDFCKKRWRSLRDTYMKKRKDVPKSGSAAGLGAKWRYGSALSFLDPSVTPRPTTSNMASEVEEEPALGDAPSALLQEDVRVTSPEPGTSLESGLQSPVAASACQARLASTLETPPAAQRKRKKKTEAPVSEYEKELLAALNCPQPSPQRSANAVFVESLIPLLDRLNARNSDKAKNWMYNKLFELLEDQENAE